MGVLIGLALLGFGVNGLGRRYGATHHSSPLPSPELTVTTTAEPSETPVSPQTDYQVPADQPRLISLPTIHSTGFVQKVGVDQHGAMATPTNIAMAGWFSLGPKPGALGVSVIDGHVQGKYQPGIFKNLSRLQPGDHLSVEFGDHSRRNFVILNLKSYTAADLAKHMSTPVSGVERQLNIITCGGRYNPKSKQYDQRILVISRLANN